MGFYRFYEYKVITYTNQVSDELNKKQVYDNIGLLRHINIFYSTLLLTTQVSRLHHFIS